VTEQKNAQETVPDIAAEAEGVIQKLKRDNRDNIQLTKSQIRKFLVAVNALTNKINMYRTRTEQAAVLSQELAAEVKYLKVKLAYQSAKDNSGSVRDFVEKARLKDCLDKIGTDLRRYEKFAHYIEALVAYHKFYGGRD
jgi:hypothetical protein